MIANSMFKKTAALIKVPDGSSDPAQREPVETGIKIGGPFPASKEQRERHDMSNVPSLLIAFMRDSSNIPIPNTHMLEVGGKEYRIRGVSPWPLGEPMFYELLLEMEGIYT